MNNLVYVLEVKHSRKNSKSYKKDAILVETFFDKETAIKIGVDFLQDINLEKSTYNFTIKVICPDRIHIDENADDLHETIDNLLYIYKGTELYLEMLKIVDYEIQEYDNLGNFKNGYMEYYSEKDYGETFYMSEYDFNENAIYKYKTGDYVSIKDEIFLEGGKYIIDLYPKSIYSENTKQLSQWSRNYTVEGIGSDGEYSYECWTDHLTDYNMIPLDLNEIKKGSFLDKMRTICISNTGIGEESMRKLENLEIDVINPDTENSYTTLEEFK